MDQTSCTLDQAIENLNKIIAHITVERDFKEKGEQVGNGWKQLKCIKDAVTRLGFLDRRKYKKIITPLEQRLRFLEDNFISEVELDLTLSDCEKLNDMLAQVTKLTKAQRDEYQEKMIFLKEQLQMIVAKNEHRVNDPAWKLALSQTQEVILNLDSYIRAQTTIDMRNSVAQMQNMFKTIRPQERMIDEEEEDLLLIIEKAEELRRLQADINLMVGEQGEDLNNAEQQVQSTNKNTEATLDQYNQAHDFVKMRRRTKIKLFFTGLFAAIGSIGGKIGALFGASFGASVGSKAAKTLNRQSTI